jgi:hypothetical protein
MKTNGLVLALGFMAVSGLALAEPMPLSGQQLDKVTAGGDLLIATSGSAGVAGAYGTHGTRTKSSATNGIATWTSNNRKGASAYAAATGSAASRGRGGSGTSSGAQLSVLAIFGF